MFICDIYIYIILIHFISNFFFSIPPINGNEIVRFNCFLTNATGDDIIHGSILFHRNHLLISHLSNETTIDIYRFLIHYGHLNLSQFYYDTWHLLLFKEIFPSGYESKQRSFLIVCSQGELTLAVIIQTEYEKNDFK
ncbi:unnamed protein product [Rotaria sp. Silwood2]|nr:unnamed protein product [Rotaria sp. Silwood2]